MLQVTDRAMTMLDAIRRDDSRVLRIEMTNPRKLVLKVGDALVDDVVIDRDGRNVLHLEPKVFARLSRAVLDEVDGPQGPMLSIREQATYGGPDAAGPGSEQ